MVGYFIVCQHINILFYLLKTCMVKYTYNPLDSGKCDGGVNWKGVNRVNRKKTISMHY
jgi:hypothetical protein